MRKKFHIYKIGAYSFKMNMKIFKLMSMIPSYFYPK